MSYDYIEGKKRINNILNSKTEIEKVKIIPKNESDFTYENGIKSWVGALFVDIVDSSSLFKEENSEKVARIMRAFCSEIIDILKENTNYRDIGIRGDCVYAIYAAPYQRDLNQILDDAIMINTFQMMFQKILADKKFPNFKIGIGLGIHEDLIVKAGKKSAGINDYIWIGSAVVNASKLSSQGNRNGFSVITMDSIFYDNIKDFDANSDHKYSYYFSQKWCSKIGENVYHGDMVYTGFSKWIDGGMK